MMLDLLRRSGSDDPSALHAAAGAYIHDIVCVADDVEIMFDHNDRRPLTDQMAEDGKECLHIQRVQTDRGLIKNKDGIRLPLAHLTGQFQTLRFAAGQTGGFFAECQITEA